MMTSAEQITAPPMSKVKSPVGLVPENIWLSERLFDIKKAVERYMNENFTIPLKWIEEYNDLVKKIEQ